MSYKSPGMRIDLAIGTGFVVEVRTIWHMSNFVIEINQ